MVLQLFLVDSVLISFSKSPIYFVCLFRFYGSRKSFASRSWWRSVSPPCPGAAEVPGCCCPGNVTRPSESCSGTCCAVSCLPAPLDLFLFIRELLLFLHAQGSFFYTCALLLQVCIWSPVQLHQENTVCVWFTLSCFYSHPVIHVFVCRTDCESPASFLCSYPVANISLMRNKNHVCMTVCVCIYLCMCVSISVCV